MSRARFAGTMTTLMPREAIWSDVATALTARFAKATTARRYGGALAHPQTRGPRGRAFARGGGGADGGQVRRLPADGVGRHLRRRDGEHRERAGGRVRR